MADRIIEERTTDSPRETRVIHEDRRETRSNGPLIAGIIIIVIILLLLWGGSSLFGGGGGGGTDINVQTPTPSTNQ